MKTFKYVDALQRIFLDPILLLASHTPLGVRVWPAREYTILPLILFCRPLPAQVIFWPNSKMSRAHMLYDDEPLQQETVKVSKWKGIWNPEDLKKSVLSTSSYIPHFLPLFHVTFLLIHELA